MRAFLKSRSSWLILVWVWFSAGGVGLLFAQGTASNSVSADTNMALPASSFRRSTADLEYLVAPIALYPDPLIASMLPASAYPLEIVEAARFVKDTNNLARLDEQPWDANVKAVARVPDVIAQMDDNLAWTSDLGEAFINQPKELMDAIQTMRSRAQASGALESTAQQDVSDTNGVIEIQPAESQELYVPEYSASDVYGDYSPDESDYFPEDNYSYDSGDYGPYLWPYPFVTFGAGVFTGVFFNNQCDFRHGQVLVHDHNNFNHNVVHARAVNGVAMQRWQPDLNRLQAFGSAASSERAREARGVAAAAPRTGTATVQGRGMTPQMVNPRLSPTSRPQSPAVVQQQPQSVTIRPGTQVIISPANNPPQGGYHGNAGAPAVHQYTAPQTHEYGSTYQSSAPQVHEYSPAPRGNSYGYQSAPQEHEYSPAPPTMHEYTPPPAMHEYSAPSAPMHEYSAPSEGHVYGGAAGHVGGYGGGQMGGFGGGHGGGGGGGGGGHGR